MVCLIISLRHCFLCLAEDEIACSMEKHNEIHQIHIFKKSMIDRAKHFVMSSFVNWLYMSCHKALGFVGLGIQELMSDTC